MRTGSLTRLDVLDRGDRLGSDIRGVFSSPQEVRVLPVTQQSKGRVRRLLVVFAIPSPLVPPQEDVRFSIHTLYI